MAIHSSNLAWKIPQTEMGGGESQESDRTEHTHTIYLLPVYGSLSEKTELKSKSKHSYRPLKIFLLVLYSNLIQPRF